jgi:hypothetical protein
MYIGHVGDIGGNQMRAAMLATTGLLMGALAAGGGPALAAPPPVGGLSIKVDDGADKAHQGAYTYTVTLTGLQSMKAGTISLDLPQSMRFVNASTGGRNTGSRVEWRLPAKSTVTTQATLATVPPGVHGIAAVACLYPDRSTSPLVCSTDLDTVAGAQTASTDGGGVGIGTVLLWMLGLGLVGGAGYWFYRNRLAASGPKRHRVQVDERLFEDDDLEDPDEKKARV